jgi:hypothetical protein
LQELSLILFKENQEEVLVIYESVWCQNVRGLERATSSDKRHRCFCNSEDSSFRCGYLE